MTDPLLGHPAPPAPAPAPGPSERARALLLCALILLACVAYGASSFPLEFDTNDDAAMLGISVAGPAQRSGVGLALMTAALDYADRWTPIRRIELTVFVDNAGAIALYRRCGFEHEGTHRAFALRDGQYADVHTMARLHPNPPSVRAP